MFPRIDQETLVKTPATNSPLELAYCLMHEARCQDSDEDGRFRAMDCHNDIMDLDRYNPHYDIYGYLFDEIIKNQNRLSL
jgi:hypothetical protein